MSLSGAVLPWVTALAVAMVVGGLIWGFFFTPNDFRQGATVKIIYIHVPAAIMGSGTWFMMLAASLVWVIRRHHVSALAAKAAAPVGMVFTLIGLFKHGLHFFSFFVPQGAPKVLIPFLIVIEVISYFVRPVSLSVRLFANMLAGHTMLKVFAGLAVMISGAGGIAMTGSLLPLAALIGLTGLEVLVAALQAYVFTILTCMYLNDALHLH